MFFSDERLKESGKKMLEMVCELKEEMEQGKHPVTPKINPGDIRKQLPLDPPVEGEDMKTILEDTRNIIFPNLTHWGHPYFFSYFPSNTCDAAIIAEIFRTAFHNPGFDWKCSRANTELETVVSDWVVKALDLPKKFLFSESGGGIIINTISEGVWVMVHSAKKRKFVELGLKPTDPKTLKFVGYYTEFAHNCYHTAFERNFVHEERMIKSH